MFIRIYAENENGEIAYWTENFKDLQELKDFLIDSKPDTFIGKTASGKIIIQRKVVDILIVDEKSNYNNDNDKDKFKKETFKLIEFI